IARYYPEMTDLIDFLVDCFNREIEGLDDVEIWIHTCWGNPNMQKVFSDESYANSVEIYLDRLKGDVWTIEASENDLKELPRFGPHGGSPKRARRTRSRHASTGSRATSGRSRPPRTTSRSCRCSGRTATRSRRRSP